VIAPLSEGEYLAGERVSRVKHEYVAGEVFSMAGASKTHGTLALNVAVALRTHLRGSPCRTFIADMKLRVAEANTYYYPDVLVTCAEQDAASDAPADYVEAPKLVVEVLSPATEHIDRREKLLAYRRLPSLAEYMLIDQERRWVEIYRRTDAGWSHDIYQPGDVIDIASVGMSLDFDRLYEDSGVL
jgi:Uma2 family endonuclease